jgi:hypothetical protein
MSEGSADNPPMMQRVYDRIWLLALAALLFWLLSYVVWGLFDIFSIPGVMML